METVCTHITWGSKKCFKKDLIENAKRYAAQNNTTLTRLVEAYLSSLPVHPSLTNAPIVRRLSGVLSADVSIEDYKNHLKEKYGK